MLPGLDLAGPDPVPEVPGLAYVPEFVSPAEETDLLARVDAEPWGTELRRRVQHYGFRYDYTRRSVDESLRVAPIPPWARGPARRAEERGLIGGRPDQLIVNEYLPGQGITAHTDCVPCFGPTVLSLSLGSGCTLELSRTGGPRHQLYLEPRSLVVLSGPARYDWRHAIPARRSDPAGGRRVARSRRVSFTYRTVRLAARTSPPGPPGRPATP